jgi:hypothetical protein
MDDEPMDFNEDLEEEEEPVQKKPKAAAPTPKVSQKTPKPAPVVKGKQITVYFESTVGPGQKKQKLLVNENAKVEDIKGTVGKLFGLDPDDFHLSYGGVTMDEANPLKDYEISDGDTVLLIPASTAG